MIVDDEAPARTRLRDLLADVAAKVPNAVVAEAANGLLALEAVEGRPVDVALVDIRMPKMDGIELARHMARLEHPPAIVFVTASWHGPNPSSTSFIRNPCRSSASPRVALAR